MADLGTGGFRDNTVPLSNDVPNRASDQNLLRAGLLGSTTQSLYRGYMVTAPSGSAQTAGTQRTPYTFNFHFNPTNVNFAYDFNDSMLTPEQRAQTGVQDDGVPLLVSGASVSFTMVLDRSLEIAAVPQGLDSTGNLGVLHDIRVLQKLVGSLDSGTNGQPNGTIVSVPVTVVFSESTGGAASPAGSLTAIGLNFTGYLTMMDVDFQIFNYNMIPYRAEVRIVIRKIFDPIPDNGTGTGEVVGQNTPAEITAANDAAEAGGGRKYVGGD